MAQQIKVTDCNDCVFRAMAGWEGEKEICSLDSESRVVAERHERPSEHPDWCPLRVSIVEVSLI